jgi:hypothetical protein
VPGSYLAAALRLPPHLCGLIDNEGRGAQLRDLLLWDMNVLIAEVDEPAAIDINRRMSALAEDVGTKGRTGDQYWPPFSVRPRPIAGKRDERLKASNLESAGQFPARHWLESVSAASTRSANPDEQARHAKPPNVQVKHVRYFTRLPSAKNPVDRPSNPSLAGAPAQINLPEVRQNIAQSGHKPRQACANARDAAQKFPRAPLQIAVWASAILARGVSCLPPPQFVEKPLS